MPEPRISIVMATHNRRDVTLATIDKLRALGDEVRDAEIIVVDNASRDGTADALTRYDDVNCISLTTNLGACAKAIGVEHARGTYVVFLDDDSYPRPGSLARMCEHLDANDRLAAAGFLAHLPDGRRECCALSDVFIGCGVGLRHEALRDVGELDQSLFMAAEEYDLSFRLINRGWGVRTFTDLHVDHLKSPVARASNRLVFYDTRNNLWLAARYLPDEFACVYGNDWAQRYLWLAQRSDRVDAFCCGHAAAMLTSNAQRQTYANHRLSPEAVEAIFHLDYVEQRMRALRDEGVRSIILADWGKNVFAFVRAARHNRIRIHAIADDCFAAPNRTYRGIPIEATPFALHASADAIVIANTSPEHARTREKELITTTPLPVHRWFDYTLPTYDGKPSAQTPICQPA